MFCSTWASLLLGWFIGVLLYQDAVFAQCIGAGGYCGPVTGSSALSQDCVNLRQAGGTALQNLHGCNNALISVKCLD